MTSKPNIDDIITAFSALRLQLVEEAGELGAMAADGRQDADTLRRSGYCDFALAAEKRAQRADWIAMNLADEVWNCRVGIGPVDLQVSPAKREPLINWANQQGLTHEVFIADVQALLDDEARTIAVKRDNDTDRRSGDHARRVVMTMSSPSRASACGSITSMTL